METANEVDALLALVTILAPLVIALLFGNMPIWPGGDE
jgi:hypothetical protein